MRLIGVVIFGLLGVAIIILAFTTLAFGIYSIFNDGVVNLFFPIAKITFLPLTVLGVSLFVLKTIFMLFFGIGLVATGLFIGLNSDLMYLLAIIGNLVGLIGNIIINLYLKLSLDYLVN